MRNITNWLAEYASEAHDLAPDPRERAVRIKALQELGRSYDQISGAQFAEVMTTAHFPNYFADALSRMFYKDYEYQSSDWRSFTSRDSTPDFRDVKRFRMSEPGTLFLRGEKGEAKETSISATPYNYGVEEYARSFNVSWQTIVNDDLGKIRETPTRMARAAARFEDRFVNGLYDNSVLQATLVGLGAPYAMTGALTEPNLALAINMFMQRVDSNGDPLAIRGLNLIIPPTLEITARKILESTLNAGTADNDANIVRKMINGSFIDPYISIPASDVPWYLIASPSTMVTIPVVRLQNFDRPWVYSKAPDIRMLLGSAPQPFRLGDFRSGDMEFQVETIIGGNDDVSLAGVVDINGILYSDGSTA